MKLAEALNRRADLQKKIAQLKSRISNNVKVQEGDEPAEAPADLFAELEMALQELEALIVRINKTNLQTLSDGESLTELIARKDILSMHYAAIREAVDNANVRSDRYSRNEIKFLRTVDVNALQTQADKLAKQIREMDTRLQQANWTNELL